MTIAGRVRDEQYHLGVIDEGIGMTSSELAEANRVFAVVPPLDQAPSRLGLFVVARLAARHGATVTLAPARTGGTAARIVFDLDLFTTVADSDSGLPSFDSDGEDDLDLDELSRIVPATAELISSPSNDIDERRSPVAENRDVEPADGITSDDGSVVESSPADASEEVDGEYPHDDAEVEEDHVVIDLRDDLPSIVARQRGDADPAGRPRSGRPLINWSPIDADHAGERVVRRRDLLGPGPLPKRRAGRPDPPERPVADETPFPAPTVEAVRPPNLVRRPAAGSAPLPRRPGRSEVRSPVPAVPAGAGAERRPAPRDAAEVRDLLSRYRAGVREAEARSDDDVAGHRDPEEGS